jgi:C1A family cysteine protease
MSQENTTPSLALQTDFEPRINRVYGWKRDLPSHQENFLLVAHPSVIKTFPKQKFLTNLPPVYDQGQLGSCTANALAAAFEYEQKQQNLQDFMPSRLFIYYNERNLEGSVPYDSGAALSDGIKSLTALGVCPESMCPYDISEFATKPSSGAYVIAIEHQILASKRVPLSIDGFKTMINMGYPVAFGFTVYESFETSEVAKSGIMKMPKLHEKALGGHAVLCIGYDDTKTDGNIKGFLKVRNSWGSTWGNQGYFYMPYDYITKLGLVSDPWVITKNEAPMVKLNKELTKSIETISAKVINFISGIFHHENSTKLTPFKS